MSRPAPAPTLLPDTQSLPDMRALVVTRAGIRRLHLPIRVIDIDGRQCATVAEMDLGVQVAASQRGTHMSRLVEEAHRLAAGFDMAHWNSAMRKLLTRLDAEAGTINCRFPWFVSKSAPASGLTSLLDVEVEVLAWSAANGDSAAELKVHVPVTTLCPCSKSISRYGAHNQRSRVTVAIHAPKLPAIGEIVGVVESNASCPVYSILKREDEKYVTEAAYENPKFAEDIVRDVFLAISEKFGPEQLRVETENHESIHNHSAYALIDSTELAIGTSVAADVAAARHSRPADRHARTAS